MYSQPQPYYGAPYAPYASPYVPPSLPKTPQGLRWSVFGLGLGVGYFVAQLFVAVIVASVLANFQPGSVIDVAGLLLGMALAGVLTGILGLLAMVFYLIGVGYLNTGRNEFGPAHARNVRIALILLVVAVSLGLANAIASFILNITLFDFSGFQPVLNVGRLYTTLLVNIVIGIALSALMAGHFALSVRALARPQHGLVLNVAAAIGTATPGITGALILLQLPTYIARVQDFLDQAAGGGIFFGTPPFTPEMGVPALVSASLSLLVVILFTFVFWGAVSRIRTGELKPLLPSFTPTSGWVPPSAPVAVPVPETTAPPFSEPAAPPVPPDPQAPSE